MKTFSPSENAIYLGDNGAAYCGLHLGATAAMTGRDLSGQPLYRVRRTDPVIHCEVCGKASWQNTDVAGVGA